MGRSWLVRPTDPERWEESALANDMIVAGWADLGDLTGCGSQQELRQRLAEAYPADPDRRLSNHAGQLWRFLEVMTPGDYVVMPLKQTPGCLAIGRVVGRYRYRPELRAELRHMRAVEWLNRCVNRGVVQVDLANSLRSIQTISAVNNDPDGWRLAALAQGEADPGVARSPVSASGSVATRDRVSVVDVGDGACTVIKTLAGGHESLCVVDCGSSSISADEACDRLLEAVGNRPDLIETIVVTLFDVDHYLGFVRLAERMRARGQRFGSLRLVCPRPPEIDRQFSRFYLAMAMTVTGVRNLDLALQLEELTAGEFLYTPLSRGLGGSFVAGGRGYEVLWPLASLPDGVTRQVRNAVAQFEAVAQSLADHGDFTLRDNIELARTGPMDAMSAKSCV